MDSEFFLTGGMKRRDTLHLESFHGGHKLHLKMDIYFVYYKGETGFIKCVVYEKDNFVAPQFGSFWSACIFFSSTGVSNRPGVRFGRGRGRGRD